MTTGRSATPAPEAAPGPGAPPPGADQQVRLQIQDTIARLTHDLRTPLNSIIGFSDLLLTGLGGKLSDKQREFIDAIHRNGHVLLSLINDMLDWSTIESGRAPLRLEEVDLGALVADLRAMTEPVIGSSGLHVHWPEAARLAGTKVRGDRKRLLQLLLNLVDNARKFTPIGGTMSLSLVRRTDALVITVEDSGPGIPPAEVERIFRPYGARSPLPSARAAERLPGSHGTGLGLPIVRSIVQMHRGTIAVDKGRHGGACFTVTLPQS